MIFLAPLKHYKNQIYIRRTQNSLCDYQNDFVQKTNLLHGYFYIQQMFPVLEIFFPYFVR